MAGFKKFKNKLANKEVKVLLENFISLSLLNVLGYIFPILTLPYLARVLGIEKIGEIAFASSIMVYLQTFVDWGFNFTGTRDIAKSREDLQKVKVIFNNIMWAKILLTILAFFLLSLLIVLIPFFYEKKELLLISFLLVVGNTLFPQWLFQGMEKMKYITFLNLISKLLFTIAVFVFIKKSDDYLLQPFFISLGYLVAGVISLFVIKKYWKIKIMPLSLPGVINSIKSSYDVFLNQLMPNLYNSFSTMLLSFIGGSIPTGKLDAGSKFTNIGMQLNNIINRVFFPYLSRREDKHAAYAKISISIALVLSVGLFVFAPFIIKVFYTKEFYDSIQVLRIMSFSLFFIALSGVYGTNYMIIKGYERKLRNITFTISILGFIMAFPLVYYFSYIGAALNIVITRALLGVVIMFYSKRIANYERN